MKKQTLIIIGLVGVVVLFGQTHPTPDPREWQMVVGTVLQPVTDPSGQETFEDVGTAFMYNHRTGITYQFFNTCADSSVGCFSQIPYSLEYKGEEGYWTRPDPTNRGLGGLPQ